MIEHLLLAMIRHQPFRKILEKFGTAVPMLEHELESYIDGLKNIESKDPEVTPKKTSGLERLFNRAITQTMFHGRRQISTIDLYMSILTETNSHAQYFLMK